MSLCRTTNRTNSPDNDNKDRRSFKQRDDDDALYVFANVKEREKERERETKINPTSDCIKSNESNYCLLVFYQKCVFLLLMNYYRKLLESSHPKHFSRKERARLRGKFLFRIGLYTRLSDSLFARAQIIIPHVLLNTSLVQTKTEQRKKGAFFEYYYE